MRDALAFLDRQLGRVAGLFACAGAAGIVMLLGVTVVAVIWRYILNAPIYGISDISIVTLTVVAAAAVSFGAGRNAHVSINLISYFFGRGVTRCTDALMRVLVAATAFLSAYALVAKSCGLEKACITSNLSIEHRPFFFVLAAAMAYYGLFMTVRFLAGLAHWHDPVDPHELED